MQPQFLGDPRPQNSVLQWTRGVRQPRDPLAEGFFTGQGAGSAGSAVAERGIWAGSWAHAARTELTFAPAVQ